MPKTRRNRKLHGGSVKSAPTRKTQRRKIKSRKVKSAPAGFNLKQLINNQVKPSRGEACPRSNLTKAHINKQLKKVVDKIKSKSSKLKGTDAGFFMRELRSVYGNQSGGVTRRRSKKRRAPTPTPESSADSASSGSKKRQRVAKLPDSAEEYFNGDTGNVDPSVLKCAKILSLALIASVTGGAGAAVYFYGLHYGTAAALQATWTKLQSDIAGCGEISTGTSKRGLKGLVNYFLGEGPGNLFTNCVEAWREVHRIQDLIEASTRQLYTQVTATVALTGAASWKLTYYKVLKFVVESGICDISCRRSSALTNTAAASAAAASAAAASAAAAPPAPVATAPRLPTPQRSPAPSAPAISSGSSSPAAAAVAASSGSASSVGAPGKKTRGSRTPTRRSTRKR